jgi:hypothetical protein
MSYEKVTAAGPKQTERQYGYGNHPLGGEVHGIRQALEEIEKLATAHAHVLEDRTIKSHLAGHLHAAHDKLKTFQETLRRHAHGKVRYDYSDPFTTSRSSLPGNDQPVRSGLMHMPSASAGHHYSESRDERRRWAEETFARQSKAMADMGITYESFSEDLAHLTPQQFEQVKKDFEAAGTAMPTLKPAAVGADYREQWAARTWEQFSEASNALGISKAEFIANTKTLTDQQFAQTMDDFAAASRR